MAKWKKLIFFFNFSESFSFFHSFYFEIHKKSKQCPEIPYFFVITYVSSVYDWNYTLYIHRPTAWRWHQLEILLLLLLFIVFVCIAICVCVCYVLSDDVPNTHIFLLLNRCFSLFLFFSKFISSRNLCAPWKVFGLNALELHVNMCHIQHYNKY